MKQMRLIAKRRLFASLSTNNTKWAAGRQNIFKLCGGRVHEYDAAVASFMDKNPYPNSLQNRALSTSLPSSSSPLPLVSPDSQSSLETIRTKAEQLSTETEDIFTKNSSSVDVSEIMNVIEKWHQLSKSIQIPKSSLKRSRFASQPPSSSSLQMMTNEEVEYLKAIKLICAEEMDRLLDIHLDAASASSIFNKNPPTRLFSLVMEAWKDSGSPLAGSNTAKVLASWGNLYGGDLDHAPTIDHFNTVLDAHAISSRGDYRTYQIENAKSIANANVNSDSDATVTNLFPAEQSWDLYSFLSTLNDNTLLPNVVSCSHLVHALANHAFVMRYASTDFQTDMTDEIAGIRAYSVWKKMMDLVSKGNSNTNPFSNETSALVWRAHADVLTLSSHGMLRRGSDESDAVIDTIGRDTEELLRRIIPMMPKIDSEDDNVVNCIQQCYSATMIAWVRQIERSTFSNDDAMLQVVTPIEALIALMEEQKIPVMPEHYHAIIQAYATLMKSDLSNVDAKIQRKILHRMTYYLDELEGNHLVDDNDNDGRDVNIESTMTNPTHPRSKVEAAIFYTVINSFYQCSQQIGTHAADLRKAESVFERMLDSYVNDLLWVERGEKHLANSLNRILEMQRHSPQKDPAIFHLYDRFRSLGRQLSDNRGNSIALRLDSGCYLAYLNLLLDCKHLNISGRVISAFKDMKYDLRSIIPGNLYNIGIMALGSMNKGKEAKELLLEAIRGYNDRSTGQKEESNFKASALYTSYITYSRPKSSEALKLLNTLERIYHKTDDPNLKPDINLYASVLNAISHDRDNTSLSRAMDLFRRIETLYEDGDSSFRPNKICFNPVFVALSKSGRPDCVKLADNVLHSMEKLYEETGDEDIKPDHIIYSSILLIMARGPRPTEIDRATELLNLMEAKARRNEISWPGTPAYSSYLRALNKSEVVDKGDRAESILRRMDKMYANGAYAMKADVDIYNSVIQAWALSNTPNKASKAWAIFEEMSSRFDKSSHGYAKPLTSVLNACNHTSGRENRQEAIRIALRIHDMMSCNNHDRRYTPTGQYFLMLTKAFGMCSSNAEREKHVQLAFEHCCKEGLLDQHILNKMKMFAPKLYSKLQSSTSKSKVRSNTGMNITTGTISLHDLPPVVSRNVSHTTRRVHDKRARSFKNSSKK